MDSPKTRRAVIIGATSGIGYEVAQLLPEFGISLE